MKNEKDKYKRKEKWKERGKEVMGEGGNIANNLFSVTQLLSEHSFFKTNCT